MTTDLFPIFLKIMTKKNFAYYKHRYKFYKEMEKHYRTLYETSRKVNKDNEWLIDSAIWEIKFYSLCDEYLLSVLDEIEVLCWIEWVTKQVIKWVIANAKERRNIDKIIHTQKLFPNEKWFNNKLK